MVQPALLAAEPATLLTQLSPTSLQIIIPAVTSYDLAFAETISLALPAAVLLGGVDVIKKGLEPLAFEFGVRF